MQELEKNLDPEDRDNFGMVSNDGQEWFDKYASA
jgi:hypothetical protein